MFVVAPINEVSLSLLVVTVNVLKTDSSLVSGRMSDVNHVNHKLYVRLYHMDLVLFNIFNTHKSLSDLWRAVIMSLQKKQAKGDKLTTTDFIHPSTNTSNPKCICESVH